MSRTVKTPRQRAEEALAVADRKLKRLNGLRDQYRNLLDEVDQERDFAIRRREYLAQDPALEPDKEPTTP